MGVRKETQGAAGKTAGGAAPVVRQNRAPVRHPCREVLSGVSTGRLLAAGAGQYYSSREALRDKGMAPSGCVEKGYEKRQKFDMYRQRYCVISRLNPLDRQKTK
jgi:hypothetical protein